MANRELQGRFSISTVNPIDSTTWQLIGEFSDNYAKFTGLDVQSEFTLGKTIHVYVTSPTEGNVDRFKISSINSADPMIIDVNVVYDEQEPMASPVGGPISGDALLAEASTNFASMTPVMIASQLDERLYNYTRNVNDKLISSPSTTVVPETNMGQASAVGTSTNYARGDHTHGTPSASTIGTAVGSTTVTSEIELGQLSNAGTATTLSRGDHTHGTPSVSTLITGLASTSVASETSFGQTASVGVASTFSRGDHTHGSPTTPVTTFNKSGSTALTGAVTISEGSNITITQTGQDLQIASTGGSSGPTTVKAISTAGYEVSITYFGSTAPTAEWNISDGTILNVTFPSGMPVNPILYIRVPASEFGTFDTNLTIHMNNVADQFNNDWTDRMLPIVQSWAQPSSGSPTDNGSSIIPSTTYTDFDVTQMSPTTGVINAVKLIF